MARRALADRGAQRLETGVLRRAVRASRQMGFEAHHIQRVEFAVQGRVEQGVSFKMVEFAHHRASSFSQPRCII
jgi:hypothetical protein